MKGTLNFQEALSQNEKRNLTEYGWVLQKYERKIKFLRGFEPK